MPTAMSKRKMRRGRICWEGRTRACAARGERRQRALRAFIGRKNLGEAEWHRLRHWHGANISQTAVDYRYVRSGATAEGHGFGGHRHRSEFRHDRVLEPAVSRKP